MDLSQDKEAVQRTRPQSGRDSGRKEIRGDGPWPGSLGSRDPGALAPGVAWVAMERLVGGLAPVCVYFLSPPTS